MLIDFPELIMNRFPATKVGDDDRIAAQSFEDVPAVVFPECAEDRLSLLSSTFAAVI